MWTLRMKTIFFFASYYLWFLIKIIRQQEEQQPNLNLKNLGSVIDLQ